MNAVEDWLAAVEARDLTICGSCDGGLPMACTCGDPRASLALTVAALRAVAGIHYDEDGYCPGCGLDAYEEECEYGYCPTIRAVVAALGVTP